MQQSAAIAGIQPDVFWNIVTYRDLQNYLIGYGKRNTDEWRRTRLQAWIVYAANTDKDRKSMTEWLPLPDDAKEKPKQLLSKEQWDFMKKNWN